MGMHVFINLFYQDFNRNSSEINATDGKDPAIAR